MMTSSRLARFLLLFILSGAALHGFLTKAHAQDTTPPMVISTYPANNTANVSGDGKIGLEEAVYMLQRAAGVR